MKCKIPEISWHNRDPVLSVDIQPKSNANNYYRLASGGTDAHVLIWYMKLILSGEYDDIKLDLAADLSRHQRAVNVVKWSPNGELLASGDDESVIFIWKQKSDTEPVNVIDLPNDQDKEVWITLKVLRGHMEDIYDLSWAPNSLFLVSGSVDNSAMIWDIQKGKSMAILKDHKSFVQGVAWDPKNQYIATLSTDRYMRIFDIQSKKVVFRVNKATLPVPEDNYLHGKRMRLFHDDTLQTFFRRLSFTPDGKLLLTPAGVTDYDGCTTPLNTTYAFSRYSFRQPAIVLPCPDQYTVAVKCCPLLYNLRPFNAEKNPPVVPLPYRMIFAVATKSSVYFYDTQQKQPFAVISNIHYTRLTDITWSNDGRIVVVSSTDGFCSLITFERGELGEEYENSEAVLEVALAQVAKKTKKQKDSDVTSRSRKPSTEDNASAPKEISTVQKESQLTPITEQKTKEISTEFVNKVDCKIHTREVKADGGECNESFRKDEGSDKEVPSVLVDDEPATVTEPENINNPKKKCNVQQGKEDLRETISKIEDDINPKETCATEQVKGIDTNRTQSKSECDNNPTATSGEEKLHCSEKSSSDVNIVADDNKPVLKSPKGNAINYTTAGIKRKVESAASTDDEKGTSAVSTEDTTSPRNNSIVQNKLLPAEIIIDKEILSSDEKFESPEKKSRPATPITIRRHPRTPNSLPQTVTTMTNILKIQIDSNKKSTISNLPEEIITPVQDKRAKPIAVRRTPRNFSSAPSVVNTTSLVEEAMDAWPLDKGHSAKGTEEKLSECTEKVTTEEGITPLAVSEATFEHTEDIRLVYEETVEESPSKESLTKSLDIERNKIEVIGNINGHALKSQTPTGSKTPRRVALTTISTPKSKKKLSD